jgi:outer membrane biosynthesis protein TonB
MTSVMPTHSREVGIAGTAIAHGTLIALVLIAAHPGTRSHAMVYEVNLVAAPLPDAGTKAAETVPTAPKSVAPPARTKVTKPAPAPKKPPAVVQRADPKPKVTPPVVPVEGATPSTGQNVVTVHQDGVVFPFPEYLNHIEDMIYNRWNHAVFRPGLEAKIAFIISKDGSVADASYVVEKHSSNAAFDDAGRQAIEAVAAHHEFGPLPDGFNGPSLSILFVFTQAKPGSP